MTTKQIGNVGEAMALAGFVQMQIPVYIPFGDNERADLIAEFNGKLQKIQVKTSEKCEDGKVVFSLVSSTVHRQNGVKHVYTKDEIDYFVLYNIETHMLLLVPQERVAGMKVVTFQIEWKPSRNQYEALNWKDFTFKKIISVETVHETSQVDEDTVQTTTE